MSVEFLNTGTIFVNTVLILELLTQVHRIVMSLSYLEKFKKEKK